MLQRFENFISKNSLFNKEQPLLLGLSGGADSICLFHLLQKGGFNFSVAHCNFQLRGEESNGDEKFVLELAERYKVKVFSIRFDTKAVSLKEKKGIQELARDLRYKWFKDLMKQHHFEYLLTAHHQTDNLETMLINALRGTGIKGLHGIPLNESNIVRPLMFTKRDEILAYLSKNGHTYREDISNASDYYLRNQIRHSVLPELNKVQPEAEQRFFETSQKVKAFELMCESIIKEKWEGMIESMDGNLKIDLNALNKLEYQALFLFNNLQSYGFSWPQIEDILNVSQIGKRVISNEYVLIKERDFLQLQLLESVLDSEVVIVNKEDNVFKIGGQSIEIHILINNFIPDFTQKDTLFINVDNLSFPLSLRLWQDGDRIRPLGMEGYKKVSDILTDKKVENSKRPSFIIVQQYDKELIALLPLVISENHKIEANTKSILSISINMA